MGRKRPGTDGRAKVVSSSYRRDIPVTSLWTRSSRGRWEAHVQANQGLVGRTVRGLTCHRLRSNPDRFPEFNLDAQSSYNDRQTDTPSPCQSHRQTDTPSIKPTLPLLARSTVKPALPLHVSRTTKPTLPPSNRHSLSLLVAPPNRHSLSLPVPPPFLPSNPQTTKIKILLTRHSGGSSLPPVQGHPPSPVGNEGLNQ